MRAQQAAGGTLRRRRAADGVGLLEEDAARALMELQQSAAVRWNVRRIAQSTVARPWELLVFAATGLKVTLPAPEPSLAGVSVAVARDGGLASGSVTVAPVAGKVQGATSVNVSTGAMAQFTCTGREWV